MMLTVQWIIILFLLKEMKIVNLVLMLILFFILGACVRLGECTNSLVRVLCDNVGGSFVPGGYCNEIVGIGNF